MEHGQQQEAVKRRRDPQEKRSRLLKAARELFVQYGFEKTTTKMIVERSGVSEGVLYHQFDSKIGIFRELIRLFAKGAVAAFAPEGETQLTPDQVIRNCISFIEQDRDMFVLVDESTVLLREHGLPGISDLIIPEIERSIRDNTSHAVTPPADTAIRAEFQFAIVATTCRGWLSSDTAAKREAFIQEGVRSMNALLRP